MSRGVHEEVAFGRRLLEDEAIAVASRNDEGGSTRLQASDQIVAGPAAGPSDEKTCRHPQAARKLGHRPRLVKARYYHEERSRASFERRPTCASWIRNGPGEGFWPLGRRQASPPPRISADLCSPP